MKKLIILFLSFVVLMSMILAGCGNAGNQKQEAGGTPEIAGNTNDGPADVTPTAEENSEKEVANAGVHIIEGWPDDVPAPDFGGEIESNKPDAAGINLVFRDVDPDLVVKYVEKLRAAGFDVFADQHDKSMDGVYVDEAGNPVIHHFFSAGKGEAVYNDLIGGYIIDDGYYIDMNYSDVDEYNVDNGRLVSTPKVKMYLMWKDIVLKEN